MAHGATYLEWERGTATTETSAAAYRCRLHAGQCAVADCGRRTVIHPVCTEHADSVLGVQIRPTAHGCGLFATRAFRKGQLIAPYVGRRIAGKRNRSGGRERITFDLICSEAVVRPGYQRAVSPYAVEFSARQVVDATCLRGWAGMANHGTREADRNAELVRYHVRHDGFTRFPSRGDRVALQYKDRRHYIFPEVLEHIDHTRLQTNRLSVWLKATRNIATGQPILTDYTPRTVDGYAQSDMARVVHRTVGSLCPPRRVSTEPADAPMAAEDEPPTEEDDDGFDPWSLDIHTHRQDPDGNPFVEGAFATSSDAEDGNGSDA